MRKLFYILIIFIISNSNLYNQTNIKYKFNTIQKNKTNLLQSFSNPYFISYLGTISDDNASFVRFDNDGNLVIVGYTNGTIQVTPNCYQAKNAGSFDLFIIKSTVDGKIIWATMFGGSGTEYPQDLQIDKDNNIWICGETSSNDFPRKNSSLTAMGNSDGFISEFSNTGKVLFSTVVGGENYDALLQMSFDKEGNCYAVGRSTSKSFFLSPDALEKNNPGGYAGILVKVDAKSYKIYSTYLFGQPSDQEIDIFVEAIAIDNDDNIIVGGTTDIPNYITKNSQLNTSYSGGSLDAFIRKYDKNFNVIWDELYGGSGIDRLSNIRVDTNSNNIFVVGFTTSNNLQIKGPINNGYSGEEDAYVMSLNPDGSMIWGTYIGGSSVEGKVTSNGDFDRFHSDLFIFKNNFAVNFRTSSSNIPIFGNAYNSSINNFLTYDSYTIILDFNGNPIYSTYFGGNGDDYSSSVCLIDSCFVIAGQTSSNNLATTSNAFSKKPIGLTDGFVAVFGISIPAPKDDTPPSITSIINNPCSIERTYVIEDIGQITSGVSDPNILLSDNCSITFSRLDNNKIQIKITLQNPDYTAHYKFTVSDSTGNIRTIEDYLGPISEDKSLSLMPSDSIFFGSIEYSLNSVQYLTLYNTTDSVYNLTKLQLHNNTHFSIPQSQFPIIIPAKDSVKIEIDFQPLTPNYSDVYYDTLEMVSLCSPHLIKLHGYLAHSIYKSDSRCEVNLQMNTDLTTHKNRTIINSIYQDLTDVTINLNAHNSQIEITLVDLFGNERFKSNISQNRNDFKIPNENLPTSTYFIIASTPGQEEVYKILVLK